jgi:hypothetical protein
VKGVHPDGVTRRVYVRALSGRLQDPQLRLELDGVAPEGLEGILDALLVVSLRRDRKILNPRKRGDCRLCAFFLCHEFLPRSPRDAKTCQKVCLVIGGLHARP